MSQPLIRRWEIEEFLEEIDSGKVKLTSECQPQDVYAGNVHYKASNGWEIVVFNDCNDWDYLDSVRHPDGRTAEFEYLFDLNLDHPSDENSWLRYGIPGYLKRRPEGWDGAPR